MHQEMLIADEKLVMTGHRIVDLQVPLDAILYQTYQGTIERQRGFFENIIQITNFEAVPESGLTPEQKRDLARFLEEALINVYKHAKTATRISVNCQRKEKFNVICVQDNGAGLRTKIDLKKISKDIQSEQKAYGTQQANRLARQLGGQFKRTNVQPKGTCCELRWPAEPANKRSKISQWFR